MGLAHREGKKLHVLPNQARPTASLHYPVPHHLLVYPNQELANQGEIRVPTTQELAEERARYKQVWYLVRKQQREAKRAAEALEKALAEEAARKAEEEAAAKAALEAEAAAKGVSRVCGGVGWRLFSHTVYVCIAGITWLSNVCGHQAGLLTGWQHCGRCPRGMCVCVRVLVYTWWRRQRVHDHTVPPSTALWHGRRRL